MISGMLETIQPESARKGKARGVISSIAGPRQLNELTVLREKQVTVACLDASRLCHACIAQSPTAAVVSCRPVFCVELQGVLCCADSDAACLHPEPHRCLTEPRAQRSGHRVRAQRQGAGPQRRADHGRRPDERVRSFTTLACPGVQSSLGLHPVVHFMSCPAMCFDGGSSDPLHPHLCPDFGHHRLLWPRHCHSRVSDLPLFCLGLRFAGSTPSRSRTCTCSTLRRTSAPSSRFVAFFAF